VNHPPDFSLVIATRERVEPLRRLLASLAEQKGVSLECILVDQNDDERLAPVLEEWSGRLNLRVLRATPHVSMARNLGVEAATGRFLAFPDDDCWYSAGLLAGVLEFFVTHGQYDILSVGVTDEAGVRSGNRWIQRRCEIRPVNVFRTSVTYGFFLRRTGILRELRFDMAIGFGPNTNNGGGEDTDFILSAMDRGVRGYFDSTMLVHHPRKDMLSGNVRRDRAISYGSAMGNIMRKHRLTSLWISFLAYDTARALLCALSGRLPAARLCLAHGKGVHRGYRKWQIFKGTNTIPSNF